MAETLVHVGCDAEVGQLVLVRVPNDAFFLYHGRDGEVLADDDGAGAFWIRMVRTGHEAHIPYEFIYTNDH